MDETNLLKDLREKIELIDQLKNALVQRDIRIGQLELLLAKAEVLEQTLVDPKVEAPITPLPPSPLHPVSPLLLAETKGLYPDGWTSTSAKLVFHPSSSDGEYKVHFWLPDNQSAKTLLLTPNIGLQSSVELRPGRTTVCSVRAPSDAVSPANLTLETTDNTFKNGKDVRSLGAFLIRVVWSEGHGGSA